MAFTQLAAQFLRNLTVPKSRRKTAHWNATALESLEPRLVLYAASGNAWPSPEVITISFEPDGTNLGGVSSDLFAKFNANMGSAWQAEILRAAQVWAQQTNINFVVVSDNGSGIGSGAYQQGSNVIGDIRIGGYNMESSWLAAAMQPPPVNNFSIAGDIAFNTSITYGIGNYTDLFTVAVHEFGHALGLDHSTSTSAVMYGSYNGVKSALTSDDVSGIRSVYGGARVKDRLEGANGNETINDPNNISSDLTQSIDGLVENELDVSTTSDVDFYKVKQKAWTGSTMTVKVQATGLSMLAPKLTVYAEDKVTVLGTAIGTSGSTISVTVNGVGNNDVYYFKVQGADATSFGTGAYALIVDCGSSSATPTATIPDTALLNGNPQRSGGAQALGEGDIFTMLGSLPAPTIAVAPTGLTGTAKAGSQITVLQNGTKVGTATADASGAWAFNFNDGLAKGTYAFSATATDDTGTSLESALVIIKIGRNKR